MNLEPINIDDIKKQYRVDKFEKLKGAIKDTLEHKFDFHTNCGNL